MFMSYNNQHYLYYIGNTSDYKKETISTASSISKPLITYALLLNVFCNQNREMEILAFKFNEF